MKNQNATTGEVKRIFNVEKTTDEMIPNDLPKLLGIKLTDISADIDNEMRQKQKKPTGNVSSDPITAILVNSLMEEWQQSKPS